MRFPDDPRLFDEGEWKVRARSGRSRLSKPAFPGIPRRGERIPANGADPEGTRTFDRGREIWRNGIRARNSGTRESGLGTVCAGDDAVDELPRGGNGDGAAQGRRSKKSPGRCRRAWNLRDCGGKAKSIGARVCRGLAK